MKSKILIILLGLITFHQSCGQEKTKVQSQSETKYLTYTNKDFRFSVDVPSEWKLYGEIKNDTLKHKAIVDWGLPKIYVDKDSCGIEHSISITAYKSPKINSIEELIAEEYFRRNPITTALESEPSCCSNCRMIYHTYKGKEYKGKAYFVFKNEIGYVIVFMATPNTYEKNIAHFENFYKKIRFE